MRILYLDCFSGISGDMTVGALCDLGVKPSALEWELSKLEIGDFHMHFERKMRQNVEGVKFSIHEGATHRHDQDEPEEQAHSHAHADEHGHHHEGHDDAHEHGHGHEEAHEHTPSHAHHEHAHGRTHRQIRELINASTLSEFVKTRALNIFKRIAVAEGRIHGMPADDVAFHEVGALDSIADIVLACAGIEQLGVQRIVASPLFDGRGWIDCAHGRFPIPAMATLEILSGLPFTQVDEPFEFITPTGAAIVAEFAESIGPMPAMRLEKIGYGVGTRNLPNRPNVLRAVLGETAGVGDYETDTITRIETNIDDLSPEVTGAVIDKLLTAGALDAFLTPIQMKKNRPAVQLSVLCEENAVRRIADVIFSETTSFGLRMDRVERLKLERRFESVRTPFGEVRVKIGLKTGLVVQVAPEFESCREISEKTGQPLRLVYQAAVENYRAQRAQ